MPPWWPRLPGTGTRVIAARLGRPAATVRGWLRRAGDRHARWLYEQAVTHAARLDADVLNQVEPADSVLGDALSALAAAVAAWRRHQLRALPTWTLVVMFTGGRLLTPSRDDQHVLLGRRVCP